MSLSHCNYHVFTSDALRARLKPTSSSSNMVGKKHKVSKNKKKSWRKSTDIKEFEDFLDDQRFEERVGVTKPSDLFMIETSGNDNAYNDKVDELNTKQQSGLNDNRLRRVANSYTLFKRLESTSKIEPARSKQGPKERRKTVYNDDDKLVKFWQDKKDSIAKGKLEKTVKKQAKDDAKLRFECYNLWEANKKAEDGGQDFLKEFEKTDKKVPVHLRQKPSLLPAVQVAQPGQSYNPDKEEHEKLFTQAVNNEMNKINEDKYWTNKVEKHFVSKREAQDPQAWLVEMSEGLFEDKDEPEDENNNETAQMLEDYANQSMPRSKTRQVRRRELVAKLSKKQKEAEKKLRTKENQVFRLKTFKKELDERDERIKRRAKLRAERHIEAMYKPRQLSRHKFEDNDLEVTLPSQLTGSLRSLKVEGNVLADRFKSMQRRNIIETRVPILSRKRKYQLKKEVKRRHRDDVPPSKDDEL